MGNNSNTLSFVLNLALLIGFSFKPTDVQAFSNLPEGCEISSLQSSNPSNSLLSQQLLTATQWIVNPELGLGHLIQAVGNQLITQSQASPWPTIHERARLAQVPVVMYHDILPEKEVFFDVTVEEFEQHLQSLQEQGITPISLEKLVNHLSTGHSLPEKPIVLTFDDGYVGHYEVVYPLLKKYGYPALFSVFTDKIDGKTVGRSTLSWQQLQEMAADPLITIASHSISHPKDLTQLSDGKMQQEIVESKRILEKKLGIPIQYFTYPEGHYDERVSAWVKAAGYQAAFTMDNQENRLSNASKSLLAIDRFGQSSLETAVTQAWGGPQGQQWKLGFDFNAPITKYTVNFETTPLILISGGKPMTIHAETRSQVQEILAETNLAKTQIMAGVDGGFFSMKYLDSNHMIGPVLGQNTGQFIPGNDSENQKLKNRPLVLISSDEVRFVPFNPQQHNNLKGIQAEMTNVTDAFVAAAFLVRNAQPQPDESFGDLFDFNASRHRAFWGIDLSGRPVIGVSYQRVGSVLLGEMLAQLGFREAVMLDSGASTALVYQGESLVRYVPRPVPHVVALAKPQSSSNLTCTVAQNQQ